MAVFTNLPNGKCKAIVRHSDLGGRSRTKTLSSEAAARKWARKIEANLDATGTSNYHSLKEVTLEAVLRDYQEEGIEAMALTETSAGHANAVIDWLLVHEPILCKLNFTDDIEEALRGFRDRCSKSVKAGGHGNKPATATRKLAVIGSAITYAMEYKKLKLSHNPVRIIKKPNGSGTRRTRVWTAADLATFLEVAGFDPEKKPVMQLDYLPWAMLLAFETGWRRGEICAIPNQTPEQAQQRKEPKWRGHVNLDGREVYFPAAKLKNKGVANDEGWRAPISARAAMIIAKLQEHHPVPDEIDVDEAPPRLFPIRPTQVGTYWGRLRALVVKDHPHLKGITFHELRHTFTTTLVGKFAQRTGGQVNDATKLALLNMTGRRTLTSLAHYFHPETKSMALQMDDILSDGAPSLGFSAPKLSSIKPAPKLS